MQKVKNIVGRLSGKEDNQTTQQQDGKGYGYGPATTDGGAVPAVMQQTTTVPVALVPTENQGVERSQPPAPRESDEVHQKGGETVCSSEYFTKVEDRPVVKERVELVQEHRPVEKEFVVETRATGVERESGIGQVENLGTTEHVIAVTEPKGPCE